MAAVHRRRAGSAPAPAPAWRMVALIGLTGVTLYYVTSNLALYYATASQGALVQSAIPAVTAVLAAIVLKERLTRRQWSGIGLSVLGVLLVEANGAAFDIVSCECYDTFAYVFVCITTAPNPGREAKQNGCKTRND